MYRSRNRQKQNGIKGPNSALTQFLQEEGISAENIKQRWLQHQEKLKENTDADKSVGEDDEQDKIQDSQEEENELSVNSVKTEDKGDEGKFFSAEEEIKDSQDDEETETESDIQQSAGSKRAKLLANIGDDSDEEEYTESTPQVLLTPEASNENIAKQKAKSRKLLETRRRRKRKAEKLLENDDDTVPSLQELSLRKISENIISWRSDNYDKNNPFFAQLRESLGGISLENMTKLANSLTRNRALDDSTLQLFLKTELKSLTFYDCSKISFDGYKTLTIFSPKLESLSLHMCGQLNNEALLYMAEKLPNLSSIKLDGPFLINEDTWNKFFQMMQGRLKEFHISNTHRFTDANLSTLLVNCHTTLQSLKLCRLDSISNYSILPQYFQNENFHTLKLEYPYNEEDITDEIVINILGQIGQSLTTLSLNGCLELTDSIIINGLGAFASGTNNVNDKLTSLELEELDLLTSDALVYLLSQISFTSLKYLSLKRCLQLDDSVIQELMINAAKDSIERLDINSLKNLTQEAFTLMSCPNLKYLNLGFVRCVNNELIEKLIRENDKLKLIDVFGDNLITDSVKITNSVTLVGRQGQNC